MQLTKILHALALTAILSTATPPACATRTASSQASPPANPQTATSQTLKKTPLPLTARLANLFASTSKILPRKTTPPPAQPAFPVAQVRQVNLENRFALIEITGNPKIQPGSSLITVRDKSQTAELKVTALQSPPFLIADITSGSPSPGDRAFPK